MILFGESSLRHDLENYAAHFHGESNHQGKDNMILFPAPADRIGETCGEIRTRERLGGLLKFITGKPHEHFDHTGSVVVGGQFGEFGGPPGNEEYVVQDCPMG